MADVLTDFAVHRLSPALGAEVLGLDAAQQGTLEEGQKLHDWRSGTSP